jgi:hypothetical protein
MRKKFNLGGGADMGRDRKVPKVPNINKKDFDLGGAMKTLKKEKGAPVNPTQPRVKGPTKANPAGVPSIVKGILKQSRKFTKKNPKLTDKIMKEDLPQKTKDLLKKLQQGKKKK